MEAQKTQIANTVLSKKSNAGGIAIPDCKLYYRVTVTKTAWCWAQRHMQTIGIEEKTEIN
jgi:hypothetical protein